MRLEKEVENLNHLLLKMTDVVLNNLKISFAAYLKEGNIEVINDDLVNQYERLIEELCLDILVRERPYSKDLRIISGILKLVSDVERLGDHAEDIMEFASRLFEDKNEVFEGSKQMMYICFKMVEDAINSYVRLDTKKAEEVIKKDDLMDDLYKKLIVQITKLELNHSYLVYTTIVIKYLEKIADHAVNIAEWVIYIVNGYYKDKTIF